MDIKDKENYFSPGDHRLEELMTRLATLKKSSFKFKLNNSCLLVIDMQNYFLSEQSHAYIPAAKSILNNVNTLVNLYESQRLPIVITRHIDNPDFTLMSRWWKGRISKGSFDSELIDSLKQRNAFYLVKSSYDAFYQTELEDILRNFGVERILITGVMTHLCCETTARSAFVRGFEVYFVVDATATYNFEFHRSSLINLSHGFVIPVWTREIG
ncbi:MAG: isochorismatase family protein [Candidatus Hydrothermia bacterium]